MQNAEQTPFIIFSSFGIAGSDAYRKRVGATWGAGHSRMSPDGPELATVALLRLKCSVIVVSVASRRLGPVFMRSGGGRMFAANTSGHNVEVTKTVGEIC